MYQIFFITETLHELVKENKKQKIFNVKGSKSKA